MSGSLAPILVCCNGSPRAAQAIEAAGWPDEFVTRSSSREGRPIMLSYESPRTAAGLEELVSAVRAVVSRHADWRQTARLVARALIRSFPSTEILIAHQRIGDPDGYRSHLLHAEPDGTFSIVALVWQPGQMTAIHDHVTWCVFGVIQGIEHEELFRLDEKIGCLVEIGTSTNNAGDVNGFAPPGDIHRVRNVGDETAISIHIYGTDVSRIGSSVRRYYDQPIVAE
jgi:3-mercaptopropionate dioxygenase